MKNEYLITFDSKDSICTDVEKFKHLLAAHSSISFGPKSTFIFNKIEFQYQLALGKLTDESPYYDLTIENNKDETQADYEALLKEIRSICTKISGRNIIVLHDGIGESYCQKGYPIIYRTENLMRKLISKFMAISIGYDWSDASTPKEVLDSVRSEGKREKSNLLLEVDFIQLSTFLFKKYTKADANRFIDSLKEKKDNETISVGDLRQYSPFTNWEKYFSKKVNCDSEYIKSRWERLYEYRCRIAHCKGLKKSEFDDLVTTSGDICEKIQIALDSIGDIHIEKEDREELAENLSSAANKNAAEFIAKYNKLTNFMQSICESCSDQNDVYSKSLTNKTNIRMQSAYLCNAKGLIDKEESDLIDKAQAFRNRIVHQSGIVEISDAELVENIEEVDTIISRLSTNTIDDLAKLKGVDLRNNRHQLEPSEHLSK